ncbi:glycosyltransferase [Treponema socranskii]|uniref:glycosyltransferase n=1 Tax=Treponema socranskii TaxID=53419 RepID=UPI003D8E5161
MLNLNQDWPLGEIELFTTVHGLRTLEMPSDPTMIRYETSLIQKLKDIIFITIGKKIFLKKMYEINARLVADGRIHVITISNHSLASIKSFYPQLRDKEIPVFASPSFAQINGYTADTPNDIIKLSQFAIEQNKYFLVTSAARWIKNVWRTVRALDSFFTDGFAPDYKAVITGVTNKRIFTYGLKNVSRFIFLDYIHRSTLALLTSHAYAFIYPSLNEGFGYPPIESMKYGIPVAASGTSSIPEICGDAVLYFDPHSVTEIKNRLVQLLDKSVYSELKQKSQIQYKKISLMQKNDLQRLVKYIIE